VDGDASPASCSAAWQARKSEVALVGSTGERPRSANTSFSRPSSSLEGRTASGDAGRRRYRSKLGLVGRAAHAVRPEGKAHVPPPADKPQTEAKKITPELPARSRANSLVSLLRMNLQRAHKSLPRCTNFKMGTLRAELKNPHLWHQVQRHPQAPLCERDGAT